MMAALFRMVLLVSVTMSVLLLPLLLFAGRLQNRYEAKTLWVVFLVAALRLAIPVDMSLPHPVLMVEAPAQTVTLPLQVNRPVTADIPEGEVQISTPQTAAPVEEPVSLSVLQIAGAIWLSGGVLLLVWRVVSYLLARRSLFRTAIPSGRVQSVPVWVHPMLKSPMVVGLIHPAVFLPQGLTEEERYMVLCHELCHIKRHDVAYKVLFLWASCVHWFNPLVWWLGRAAGRNVELCCDDDVLRGKDKSFRRQYGEVLLTMAAGGNGPALSTQFGGSVAEMKKRLSNLFVHKKNSRILVISVLLCTLLAGMLVACQPQQEKGTGGKPIEALQETITYDGRTLSFTLPEDDVAWNILISGRMEAEGMGGMSIHYLEGTEWNPGEAYSFEMSQETAAALTELTMDVWAGEEEGSIDLLPYLDAASEKLYFSVSLTEVQRYTPPEGRLLSNPDVVPADTMGEVLVETTLSDGTDVLCYWEPDSEYTKYWAIRKGDALLRFCMEDSGYDGGYGIREYEDVLGQDGFCISGPRGAAYSFIDYYYLDKDGIPRLLVDCATQVVEQDWTGDGERELLWTYHQYEGHYYFRRDGDIYLCSLNALLQTARPDWEEIAIHLGETDDPLYVTYEKDGTAYRASLSFTQTDLLVETEI